MKKENLYEEIRKHEARIAELATELRNELESLAESVRGLEDKDVECEDDNERYYTPKGTEMSGYDIQNLADSVEEIENEYDV